MAQENNGNRVLNLSPISPERLYGFSQKAKQVNGLPILGSSLGGQFAGAFGSSLLRGIGDSAQFLNLTPIADALHSGANTIDEYRPRAMNAEASLKYATSPEGIGQGLGNLLGAIASIAVPTIPFGGAITKGAQFLSKAKGLKALGNENFWGNVLRGGLTGPIEASMEAGNTERRLLEQGIDPETARQRAWGVFGKNVGLLTASNAAQFGLFNKILNGTGWKSRFGNAGLNSLIQGGEEYAQQGIQNLAEDKPFAENAGQAFLEGTLPMIPLGMIQAGFGALAGRNRNKNKNPQPSQDEQPTIQTSPSSGSDYIDWIHGQNIKGKDETANKVITAAQKYGVDPKLALSVAIAETGNFNQNDISTEGAIGVMQLMPATARELGVDPYNEDQNIDGGMRFLKDMLDRFNGDTRLATAAYNAGPSAVERFGGVPPYGETQAYVNKIAGVMDIPMAHTPSKKQSQQPTKQQGNNYLGENGQGEGKYWTRQNSGITLQGAQLQTLNAIDALGKWFYDKTGKQLIVTSVTGGRHADGAHSHANGWKFDINDSPDGSSAYGYILDQNSNTKGSLADEMIKYGRSLGLGMNWEGDHIDVAVDGTQWDGNGGNVGGFNPSKAQIQSPKTKSRTISGADDPNFTARQNAAWREAQWVAKEAKERYGYNLNPGWIFAQWRQETGENFDAGTGRMDNIGGLKDTSGKMIDFTQRGGLHGYAEHFLTGFLEQRPKLKDAKTAEDYWLTMWKTGYFGNYPDPNNDNPYEYRDTIVKYQNWHPNTQGYSESGKVTRKVSLDYETLYNAFKPYEGQTMDNGTIGCVEAVTKIGSSFSPFLKEEFDKGNVSVEQLRDAAKAKGLLIPYDESKLELGDVIVWKSGDRSHVVISDGKGGFFGNSSSRNKVIHGDYMPFETVAKPDYIIKTGSKEVEIADDETETSTEEETPTVERDNSTDKIIEELLKPTSTPQYNLEDDNDLSKNIFQNILEEKFSDLSGEDVAKFGKILQNLYNDKGELQNTKENRLALAQALGGDTLKNLGQEKLNSKIEEYKNFLQTQLNPLQKEIDALTEKHNNAKNDYEFFRTAEGLQGSGHGRILKHTKQSIIDSKKELDDKIADLERIQKILNPEVQKTAPVEKFTATLNPKAKTKPTDKNLLNLLELEETPTFNPLSKNAVTRNIIENFIKQKISSTQDKSLKKFLDADNKLISNQTTRQKISKQFGDELQTFGQIELDKRLEELKSRYKIERPFQRESVDVLPENQKAQ